MCARGQNEYSTTDHEYDDPRIPHKGKKPSITGAESLLRALHDKMLRPGCPFCEDPVCPAAGRLLTPEQIVGIAERVHTENFR